MASKKISQFDLTTNPALTSVLPIVDDGTTLKVELSTLINQANTFVNANSANWQTGYEFGTAYNSASATFATSTTVNAVSGAVDSEISRATTAEGALSSRITSLSSSVDSQVTGLQTQISFIASNVDPAALDSLTEVVSAFQAADNNLNGAITSLANTTSSNVASIHTFVTSNSAGWVEPARNFDLVGNASYCGVAPAGSSNAASVWKITKVTFALDGSVASTGVASNVAWDNRLTETYL